MVCMELTIILFIQAYHLLLVCIENRVKNLDKNIKRILHATLQKDRLSRVPDIPTMNKMWIPKLEPRASQQWKRKRKKNQTWSNGLNRFEWFTFICVLSWQCTILIESIVHDMSTLCPRCASLRFTSQ